MMRELQRTEEGGGGLDGAAGAGAEPPDEAALMAQGLQLTTMAGLAMSGRFEGMASAEGAAVQAQDLRAKVYAVLQQVGFDAAAGGAALTPPQRLQVEAVQQYRSFCEAEAWRDVEEELQREGCRPVSADAAAMRAVLDATRQVAADVLEAQTQQVAGLAEEDAATEAGMLSRVRVLRDGPMGGLEKKSSGKGVSLFRKRLEAKARIGDMVAASKVGYEGPMPSADEYADAKVAEFKELKGSKGLKLGDVPASLDSLATAAGLEPARVAPFLEQTGVQADLDAAALMDVQIFPDVYKQGNMSRAVVDIVPGPERADEPLDEARLKELMLEFQATEAAAGRAS